MGNIMYEKAIEAFGNAQINWPSDTIKAVLVDTGTYTLNAATHEFLSDIPSGARIATSAALTGKTNVLGVLDANDSSWPGVTGVSGEAVVIIKDTGTVGTSRLIWYLDTASGLPVTPNGGDINIKWDDGANKIGRL
ncbi:Bacteriophage protein [Mycobacteroides abscessus subsp. bolletii]|nr:Bacteriophage protein [Mycobacteroides abscessus subsp. bolletii]